MISFLRGKPANGDALILVAMVLLGLFPVFLRLLPNVSTLMFLFAFQFVAAIALAWPARKSLFKIRRHDLWLLVLLAVAGLATDLLYFAAYRTTSVANAAISQTAVSIFLAILAPLIIKQKTRNDEWIALVIALAGIAILYSHGISLEAGRDLLGITFGLASALSLAVLILLYGIIPKRGMQIRVINFYRFSIASLIMLPLLPWMGISSLDSADIVPLVGFGVLFGVVASGLHNLGISRTRPMHASILGKAETVFAVLFGFLLLHEPPTWQAIVGGILIIGPGIWLTIRHARRGYDEGIIKS